MRSWARDAAITLAVAYVLGWFALTLGVAGMNRATWRPPHLIGIAEKSLLAEPVRQFMVARDVAITPMTAGLAFESLQPESRGAGVFERRAPAARVSAPWQHLPPLDKALFAGVRSSTWWGPPSLGLIAAVPKGFSAKEREVLRLIGTAPLWRTYDLVAAAPRVDLVGGRFLPPFGADATYWNMPILRFAATKELAYAGVSRAAWHLSEGRQDSAEAALRAVVSFGFAMHDNAATSIEQLIGNVITGIGRGGLEELFAVTKDPRGPALAAAIAAAPRAPLPALLQDLSLSDRDAQRRALIQAVGSPALGRGVRYQALEGLRWSSCGNLRELVVGPNPETRSAFETARRDLARFPSEVAVVDLIQGGGIGDPAALGLSSESSALMRLADVAGRIYVNPRLSTCALAGWESRVIQ
ncbi:MAG: hypothetical protein P3A28_01525 [Gemmatimonadota bacterium]|nr:hypothetical protein [Gemmatimonadota bacterium]